MTLEMEVPFMVGEKKQLLHELKAVLAKTRAAAMVACEQEWGLTFGGLFPGAGQYGETSLRLRHFGKEAVGMANTEAFVFDILAHSSTGDGSWPATSTIINSNVPEDTYIGVVGFAFPGASHPVTMMQMEAGGQTMGVVNVEEVAAYEEPIVIFKHGMVVPEKMPVKIHACTKTAVVDYAIVPIGFAFVKKAKFIGQTMSVA